MDRPTRLSGEVVGMSNATRLSGALMARIEAMEAQIAALLAGTPGTDTSTWENNTWDTLTW